MNEFKVAFTIEAEDLDAATALARTMGDAAGTALHNVKVAASRTEVTTFGDATAKRAWMMSHNNG